MSIVFGTTGAVSIHTSNGVDKIMLDINREYTRQMREDVLKLKPLKVYRVEIKEYNRNRSLDSNAYAWVLMTKLAAVLKTTKEEVYREFVKDIDGAYVVVPIPDKGVETFIKNWGKHGTGWIAEDLGESKLDGFHRVMAHYGSSTFDQKQMSQMIDLIVQECEAQGISTMNTLELEALVRQWGKVK